LIWINSIGRNKESIGYKKKSPPQQLFLIQLIKHPRLIEVMERIHPLKLN